MSYKGPLHGFTPDGFAGHRPEVNSPLGRAAGRQAASSGVAFATTWALGQVAKQYYGGGRRLDTAGLRAAFAPLLDQGRGMLSRYAPEIERRAAGIDRNRLRELVSST